MRVRIGIVWLAMGGPTGVCDTYTPVNMFILGMTFEIRDLAFGFIDVEAVVV